MEKSNFKLKTLAAAVGLMMGGAVHAAPTAIFNWGEHQTPSDAPPAEMQGSIMFSGGVLTPFDHVYNFHLNSPSNGLVVTVTNDASPSFDIQGATLTLWQSNNDGDYTNDTLITTYSFDSTAVNTTFSVPSGNYFYEVSGNMAAGTLGGSYLISSTVSPVPEPETYAMLLAGLGLIGFSLRNRRAV